MSTIYTLVTSPEHRFPGHEEAPSRFHLLGNWEEKPYMVNFLEPEPATREAVTAVHSEHMLLLFEEACRRGPGITDYAPTFVTPSTYADAFLAAGGTLGCTQAILGARARNGFAIVRPPGHHAEREAAMGFCLLNNVAIAARHALDQGMEKVLIVDFDAHHGNGTQAIFLDEPRLSYFSTQQENIYPFRSGHLTDAAGARRRIVNLPLPARSGDAAFVRIADEVLTPLVHKFKPGMIFVSAGFDSHWNDPLAELGLSSAGYHAYACRLRELAEETCQGRLLFILEGGYNPANVSSGVDAVFCALAGVPFQAADPSPYQEPGINDRLDAVRHLHDL